MPRIDRRLSPRPLSDHDVLTVPEVARELKIRDSEARKWLKEIRQRLGAPRYALMMFHFLVMMSLPIKMYLRWAFNLKYVVAIPEFVFNI